MEQFLVDVNIKCPDFLKIANIGVPVAVCGGDRHQSPDPDMGHGLSCSGGVLQLRGGKAALGLLAADVHLQKNVLNDVLLFRLFFNGFQQRERPYGLDQGYLAHHLLDLVPLKMADEVERRAVIGVLAHLFRHLLDPVFAQHVDPSGAFLHQIYTENKIDGVINFAAFSLVGASKMNGAAACREAIAAGIDALGENRVQEMTEKLAENAYDGAPLHFIGHLQRNKVRQVVGKVALIQSVGSDPLLDEIEKQAEKLGLVQDILLEVNVGGEEA